MPRIYSMRLRPVRRVNPLVLGESPRPEPVELPAPEPEPTPEPVEETDLEGLTKAELVALADEAGVANYGTKADIIARLGDG